MNNNDPTPAQEAFKVLFAGVLFALIGA